MPNHPQYNDYSLEHLKRLLKLGDIANLTLRARIDV
jgi:hypothetical protein